MRGLGETDGSGDRVMVSCDCGETRAKGTVSEDWVEGGGWLLILLVERRRLSESGGINVAEGLWIGFIRTYCRLIDEGDGSL